MLKSHDKLSPAIGIVVKEMEGKLLVTLNLRVSIVHGTFCIDRKSYLNSKSMAFIKMSLNPCDGKIK